MYPITSKSGGLGYTSGFHLEAQAKAFSFHLFYDHEMILQQLFWMVAKQLIRN